MSDTLRDRIVAAIAAAGEQPDADVLSMADAILALPGIAVVELPEPAKAVRCWPVLVGGEPESLYLSQGEIIVSGNLRLYTDEATSLAAALLAAAAECAEKGTK